MHRQFSVPDGIHEYNRSITRNALPNFMNPKSVMPNRFQKAANPHECAFITFFLLQGTFHLMKYTYTSDDRVGRNGKVRNFALGELVLAGKFDFGGWRIYIIYSTLLRVD